MVLKWNCRCNRKTKQFNFYLLLLLVPLVQYWVLVGFLSQDVMSEEDAVVVERRILISEVENLKETVQDLTTQLKVSQETMQDLTTQFKDSQETVEGIITMMKEQEHATVNSRQKDNNDTTKDQTESRVFAPVLYNAGLGTSATHLFFDATCESGFISVHFNLACIQPEMQVGDGKNKEIYLPLAHHLSFEIHMEIVGHHNWLQECLKRPKEDGCSNLRSKDISGFLIRMKKLFIKILEQRVIVAFHDTPYTLYPTLFYQAVSHVYGKDKVPVVIMSTRDPKEWAKSRLKNHPDEICRDINMGQSNFDTCINDFLKREKKTTKSSNNGGVREQLFSFNDIFVRIPKLRLKNKDNDTSTIPSHNQQQQHGSIDKMVEGYEKGARRQFIKFHNASIYEFNAFEKRSNTHQEKVLPQTVSQELQLVLPEVLLNQQQRRAPPQQSSKHNLPWGTNDDGIGIRSSSFHSRRPPVKPLNITIHLVEQKNNIVSPEKTHRTCLFEASKQFVTDVKSGKKGQTVVHKKECANFCVSDKAFPFFSPFCQGNQICCEEICNYSQSPLEMCVEMGYAS